MNRLIRFMTALCLLSTLAHAAPKYSYQDVPGVPRKEIDSWIKKQMSAAGADPAAGRYHFVIAFSTGHYGADPLHAIAMQRIAFQILNNTCCPGDRMTTAAWEMDVWKAGRPILLDEGKAGREAVFNSIPTTSASGSRGGHDIERSIVSLLSFLSSGNSTAPRSSVIILLTNGASQLPYRLDNNDQLLGENSTEMRDALVKAGFRHPVRHDFKVETRDGDRKVSVVIVLPSRLVAESRAREARYPTYSRLTWQPAADVPGRLESLPNPEIRVGPVPPPVVYVLAIAAVLVLCGLWRISHHHGKPSVPTDDAAPSAAKPIPGTLLVRVAGKEKLYNSLNGGLAVEVFTDGESIASRELTKSAGKQAASQVQDVEPTIFWTMWFEPEGKAWCLALHREEACKVTSKPKYVQTKPFDPETWLFEPDAMDTFRFINGNQEVSMTVKYASGALGGAQ